MAWLERLETRSRAWPAPLRWLYLGVKWYLVFIGALALGRVYLEHVGLWPY